MNFQGFFSWLSLTLLYSGLLAGVDYSVFKFFEMYTWNRELANRSEYGFYSRDIELLIKIFKKPDLLFILLIDFVFALIYFVKLHWLY